MIQRLSFIVIIVLVLTSCSSDDDSGESPGVVGRWKVTSLVLESPRDFNGDGSAVSNVLSETQCSLNDIFVFNADGTGQVIADAYNIALDVDQNPDFTYFYIFECIDTGGFTIDSTWTQEGNTITVVTVLDTLIFTLSGNTMTSFEENGFQTPILLDGGTTYDLVLEDATTQLTKI